MVGWVKEAAMQKGSSFPTQLSGVCRHHITWSSVRTLGNSSVTLRRGEMRSEGAQFGSLKLCEIIRSSYGNHVAMNDSFISLKAKMTSLFTQSPSYRKYIKNSSYIILVSVFGDPRQIILTCCSCLLTLAILLTSIIDPHVWLLLVTVGANQLHLCPSSHLLEELPTNTALPSTLEHAKSEEKLPCSNWKRSRFSSRWDRFGVLSLPVP